MSGHIIAKTLVPFVVFGLGYCAGWLVRDDEANKANRRLRRQYHLVPRTAPRPLILVHPEDIAAGLRAHARRNGSQGLGL